MTAERTGSKSATDAGRREAGGSVRTSPLDDESIARRLSRPSTWLVVWAFMIPVALLASEFGVMLTGFGLVLPLAIMVYPVFSLAGLIFGIGVLRERGMRKPLVSILVNMALIPILFIGTHKAVQYFDIVDTWRGQPDLIAEYTGTMNSARLTFRQNGEFDILGYGFMGGMSFYKGTYDQSNQVYDCLYEGTSFSDHTGRAFRENDVIRFEAANPAHRDHVFEIYFESR